jgi:hypothetical protein
MAPSLYLPVFTWTTILLAVAVSVRYISSPGYSVQEQDNSNTMSFVLMIGTVLTFWLGFRNPHDGNYFGDTVSYTHIYDIMDITTVKMDWHSEWIWQWLQISCKVLNQPVSVFYLIVEALYVFSAIFAVYKFFPRKPLLGMLFVWLSLMYFTFGVNGIRNGLACHIVLLAFAFFLEDKYVPAVALALTAFGIHRSVFLPIVSILAMRYVIKDVKYAIYFWIASIFISLVAGSALTNIFTSLGFDDRMATYTKEVATDNGYTKLGFRWDFLVYSAIPVAFAWYVCVKRQIEENWFRILAGTYCLANAFWVIVIRAEFSNRFAYLSWFIYPIVIAYPLINMPVWDDQDRKIGYYLLAYSGFTAFMQFIFW